MSDQAVFLEEERQLILLALAQLAARRPGWTAALAAIAAKLAGEELFEYFKSCTPQKETPHVQ